MQQRAVGRESNPWLLQRTHRVHRGERSPSAACNNKKYLSVLILVILALNWIETNSVVSPTLTLKALQ